MTLPLMCHVAARKGNTKTGALIGLAVLEQNEGKARTGEFPQMGALYKHTREPSTTHRPILYALTTSAQKGCTVRLI